MDKDKAGRRVARIGYILAFGGAALAILTALLLIVAVALLR
ncbi:hypothetical protein [Actinoplanes sp. NBRC 103695]|nr:hypothetical protein [Actinoplanes sp. NBRC 103695]